MANKIGIHSKIHPVPGKTSTDLDHHSHQPSLDRIDELQDFYDFSPVGYLTLDKNGCILDANPTISMMIKVPKAEAIGQSFYAYIHLDDRDTLHLYLKCLFKNKRPRNYELRIQYADEKLIPVVLVGILAEDREDRWVCRSVLMDITERKELEEALHKSEQEKTVILDSLMERVVYHDLEMRVLWANRAAYESVQMKREVLMGRYCYEIWADRRSPCEDCPVMKARKTGQLQMVEKVTPGGQCWYIQGQEVRDSNGQVSGTTELTLEITARRRADEALRKAKHELEIRVMERTAELENLNKELRKEIENRKKFEADLRLKGERILQEQNRRKYLSKKLIAIHEKIFFYA